jgi:putative phage-type endonuclease
MRFTIIDAPQRSDAWFQSRAGRLTGSRAADVLATIKSGEAAARRDYRMQLVTERLTGQPQDDGGGFVNAAMQRGVELEPKARLAYESITGNVAGQTGFLAHTEHMAGCSLDAHVDDFKGIVEIKCPKASTHLKYWRGKGEVPSEHLPQITHNLWVTGAEWCDFLSFDDRFPADLQTFLVRVKREDVDIAGYEKKALAFLEEVDAEVSAIKTMTGVK